MKKLKKNAKFILIGLAGITITTASFFMLKDKDNKQIEKINVVDMVNETTNKEVLLNDMTLSINKDIIGYFTFEQNTNPDTKILPVILTEGDYYMNHDMYGNKDGCGAIFIDSLETDENSNNTIVYGHSSTKKYCNFTFFKSYKEKTYFNQNEYFTYTDTEGEHKYQILFMSMYDLENHDIYLDWYNNYFESEQQLIEVLNKSSEYAVSDKRLFTIDKDDKILTLVTCDMSKKDARFVIYAKEV